MLPNFPLDSGDLDNVVSSLKWNQGIEEMEHGKFLIRGENRNLFNHICASLSSYMNTWTACKDDFKLFIILFHCLSPKMLEVPLVQNKPMIVDWHVIFVSLQWLFHVTFHTLFNSICASVYQKDIICTKCILPILFVKCHIHGGQTVQTIFKESEENKKNWNCCH